MNITELRAVCQKPHEWNDGWYTRKVTRFLSIHLTRVMVAMGVSAGCVTALMIVTGFAGALLLASAKPYVRVYAVLLLQLWYLFDCVDGEVARLTGRGSVSAQYADYLSHYLVHPLIFASLAAGIYRMTGSSAIFGWGFCALMAVLFTDLAQDCRYKTVYFALCRGRGEGPEGEYKRRAAPAASPLKKLFGCANSFFSSCYFLFKPPAVMNLVTLAVLLDWVRGGAGCAGERSLLIFVGAAGHLPWIATATRTLYYRETEKTIEKLRE